MDTLASYGRGSWAFLRTVGADVLRWVWEDVTGFVRFMWFLFVTFLVLASMGLLLALIF